VGRGESEAATRSYPVNPVQVLAHAADDVWVVGETQLLRQDVATYQTNRMVVLHDRPSAAPLRLLPDGDLKIARSTGGPPRPGRRPPAAPTSSRPSWRCAACRATRRATNPSRRSRRL